MLGAKVHIKDDSKDWDRMVKRSGDFGPNKNAVGIGLFQSNSSREVIERGIHNEFGTKTIPRRAFLRGWLIKFQNQIAIFLFDQYLRYITGKQSLGTTIDKIRIMGISGVVARIALGKDFKPNAARTIREKGHSRVLEKTGEMIRNITGKWLNKR